VQGRPRSGWSILREVSDLPFSVPASLAARIGTALDREGKLQRALESLGPIAGRDVVAVGSGEAERARLEAAGARVRPISSFDPSATGDVPDGAADTILCTWSAFRGVDAAVLAEADRILRPDGRLLVVHDYGRDDLATLRGDQPEYASWSRRDGPFLTNGFRLRVIHCFWTFDDLDEARSVVGTLFGAAGERLAAEMKRPRLSWNVAIYHRTRGGGAGKDGGGGEAG
jgi:SAM-dependent methyltransferase